MAAITRSSLLCQRRYSTATPVFARAATDSIVSLANPASPSSSHAAASSAASSCSPRRRWRVGCACSVTAGARPDAHPAELGSASPSSCQNSSCVSVRRGRRLPQSHKQGEACSPWPPMGWDRPEESPYKQKEKTMIFHINLFTVKPGVGDEQRDAGLDLMRQVGA